MQLAAQTNGSTLCMEDFSVEKRFFSEFSPVWNLQIYILHVTNDSYFKDCDFREVQGFDKITNFTENNNASKSFDNYAKMYKIR